MSYTITALGERDWAIHVDRQYIGAVTRFDDGIARGKPHDTYYLSSRDNFDSYYLTLERAIEPLVRHHTRDVAKAGKAAQQAAAAYQAGSSLG